MNYRHDKHYGLSSGLGHKIKDIAKFAGAVKGIYDTSRTVYSLASAAAPYVLPLLGAL